MEGAEDLDVQALKDSPAYGARNVRMALSRCLRNVAIRACWPCVPGGMIVAVRWVAVSWRWPAR